MDTVPEVPPGFRFHPTDEELVDYYLRKKVASGRIDLDVIKDVDLYKIEPWDLQEKCRVLGTELEEQNEWYFFSHKDKKYPTGLRTNRATTAGFWKATGRDKPIYSSKNKYLVGMRKTLVFYNGRAPNGRKSDWIMHEYRLETMIENAPPQEEGWVVCRVFRKRVTTTARTSERDRSSCWYDDHQISSMPSSGFESAKLIIGQQSETALLQHHHHSNLYSCKHELLEFQQQHHLSPPDYPIILQLPQLESLPRYASQCSASAVHRLHEPAAITPEEQQQQQEEEFTYQFDPLVTVNGSANEQSVEQVTDWRVMDKFVASQLSHDDISKEDNGSELDDIPVKIFRVSENQRAVFLEYSELQLPCSG